MDFSPKAQEEVSKFVAEELGKPIEDKIYNSEDLENGIREIVKKVGHQGSRMQAPVPPAFRGHPYGLFTARL